MASTYSDRVSDVLKACRAAVPRATKRDVDREFGEEMRDSRFPAGWYILPLFGAAVVVAALVVWLV